MQEGQCDTSPVLAQERHARLQAEAVAVAEMETLRRTASELQQVRDLKDTRPVVSVVAAAVALAVVTVAAMQRPA